MKNYDKVPFIPKTDVIAYSRVVEYEEYSTYSNIECHRNSYAGSYTFSNRENDSITINGASRSSANIVINTSIYSPRFLNYNISGSSGSVYIKPCHYAYLYSWVPSGYGDVYEAHSLSGMQHSSYSSFMPFIILTNDMYYDESEEHPVLMRKAVHYKKPTAWDMVGVMTVGSKQVATAVEIRYKDVPGNDYKRSHPTEFITTVSNSSSTRNACLEYNDNHGYYGDVNITDMRLYDDDRDLDIKATRSIRENANISSSFITSIRCSFTVSTGEANSTHEEYSRPTSSYWSTVSAGYCYKYEFFIESSSYTLKRDEGADPQKIYDIELCKNSMHYPDGAYTITNVNVVNKKHVYDYYNSNTRLFVRGCNGRAMMENYGYSNEERHSSTSYNYMHSNAMPDFYSSSKNVYAAPTATVSDDTDLFLLEVYNSSLGYSFRGYPELRSGDTTVAIEGLAVDSAHSIHYFSSDGSLCSSTTLYRSDTPTSSTAAHYNYAGAYFNMSYIPKKFLYEELDGSLTINTYNKATVDRYSVTGIIDESEHSDIWDNTLFVRDNYSYGWDYNEIHQRKSSYVTSTRRQLTHSVYGSVDQYDFYAYIHNYFTAALTTSYREESWTWVPVIESTHSSFSLESTSSNSNSYSYTDQSLRRYTLSATKIDTGSGYKIEEVAVNDSIYTDGVWSVTSYTVPVAGQKGFYDVYSSILSDTIAEHAVEVAQLHTAVNTMVTSARSLTSVTVIPDNYLHYMSGYFLSTTSNSLYVNDVGDTLNFSYYTKDNERYQ